MQTPDSRDAVPAHRGKVLDQASPVPVYHQLRQALESSWRSRFDAEAELPTEREIMDEFRVSRITVRRALDELINDRVIHRPRPRGRLRFSPVKVRQQFNRLRGFFADDALAAGHHPSTRVLEVGQGVWAEANRMLGLAAESKCYRISRLHESDGNPLSHQVSFIPCDVCPDLMLSDLSGSLLQMLELRYGRRAYRAEQRLSASEATLEEASLLRLPRRSHVFHVDRVSYDENGEAIEYFLSVLDVNHFEFHTSLGAGNASDDARGQLPPW